MTAYWLLLCHLVGDYWLQSDWMALEKTKSGWQANLAGLAHVVTYMLPFLLLTRSIGALAFIAGTHFVIDRLRLARYICYVKNFLAPKHREIRHPGPEKAIEFTTWWYPWSDCADTGYHKDRPAWLAVWLLFITDNTLHLICNGIALEYLT